MHNVAMKVIMQNSATGPCGHQLDCSWTDSSGTTPPGLFPLAVLLLNGITPNSATQPCGHQLYYSWTDASGAAQPGPVPVAVLTLYGIMPNSGTRPCGHQLYCSWTDPGGTAPPGPGPDGGIAAEWNHAKQRHVAINRPAGSIFFF